MMKKALIAGVALLAIPFVAHAGSDPQPIKGANDTRVRTMDKSAALVMNVTSTNLTPVTLTFRPGDQVQMVGGLFVVPIQVGDKQDASKSLDGAKLCQERASGDASIPVWCAQWVADQNQITLAPAHEDPGSLLLITLRTKTGDNVSYNIHLSTRKGFIGGDVPCDPKAKDHKDCYDDKAYFHVEYTDVAGDKKEAAARWWAAHPRVDPNASIIADRLRTDTSSAPRNNNAWFFADSKACKEFGPSSMTDDGRQTYVHFAMNTPVTVPTYPSEDQKDETAATYTSKIAPDSGRDWTFPSVPHVIWLRRMNDVCPLVNKAWNKNATTPWTGTSSPDVVRVTR